MKDGIDRYNGKWTSDDGLILHIVTIDETRASVTLLGADGDPVCRPYWDNRPTVEMPVDYDEYMDEFTVHLWTPEREYCLHLSLHTADCGPDPDEEILSPSISQHENDEFLEQYHELFGKLKDFRKTERQNASVHPSSHSANAMKTG